MKRNRLVLAAISAVSFSVFAADEVLSDKKLVDYVARFNADDDELYHNEFDNAKALDFLKANVPRFECPDADIERTYYFRWWTFRKHVKGGQLGWVVTEFLPPVGWAGPDNTISCPLGHHFLEGRWLRDPSFMDGYSRFMMRYGKISGKWSYVCWPAHSFVERRKVTGDKAVTDELFMFLVENFRTWEKGWMHGKFPVGLRPDGPLAGLYTHIDDREGMEMSLGGNGARPIVNSAMCAEARAIALLARERGETALAEEFAAKAAKLQANIVSQLWNPELDFFTVRRLDGTFAPVRELCGYAPWYFLLDGLAGKDGVWTQLDDPQGFAAAKSLTFPEQRAKGFVIRETGHECQWNGPGWPYATALTLTALINRQQADVTPDAARSALFAKLLHQYAAQQVRVREDGKTVPWIDENINPFTGVWQSRKMIMDQHGGQRDPKLPERGKDYNHSTFCDLVISGLCGIQPKLEGPFAVKPMAPADWDWWCLDGLRYHGRTFAVFFDRDGTRYGRGKGLQVVDLSPEVSLVSQRPPVEKRCFVSKAVDDCIAETKRKIADPKLAWMFENCFPNTLDTTVRNLAKPGQYSTFLVTGDIEAMWLRDSSAQVWPYLRFLKKDHDLRILVKTLLVRQFGYICQDPYANAFKADAKGPSEHASDGTLMLPGVFERKWELDSLAYPICLAYGYWKASGDSGIIDGKWRQTLKTILETYRREQRKGGLKATKYTFSRCTSFFNDNVTERGFGWPSKPCGMIVSTHRPSDDGQVFSYFIPGNLLVADVLGKAAEMECRAGDPEGLSKECLALKAEIESGVRAHGIAEHPKYGRIYAFEADGYGNRLFMDDANVPSLLGLPYFSEVKRGDPVYEATRRFVLSEDNPYFAKGTAGEGVGGPHTGHGRIWPMSVIMRALTSDDDAEIRRCLDILVSSDAGTGFMHESFDKDNAAVYSRAWFAWANTLFGELVLKLADRGFFDRKKD